MQAVFVLLLLCVPLLAADPGAAAASANAHFACFDLASPGVRLPVRLQVTNTSASDIRQLRLTTDQLFQYWLDVLVPAGQAAVVAFAPWYYDGRLGLSQIQALGSQGQVVQTSGGDQLQPRPLPEKSLLLLFDREKVRPELLEAALPQWAAFYFAAADSESRVRFQPVNMEDLNWDLLCDSPACGVVASEGQAALASVAQASGLDLFEPGKKGEPVAVAVVPEDLRRLAARSHVRPDLFDLGSEQMDHIPAALFQSPTFPIRERTSLLVPLAVMAAALLCLAMVAFRLPRMVQVVLIFLVVIGGAVWTMTLAGGAPLQTIDAISVVCGDARTGRTFTEHLAAVGSQRLGLVRLEFPAGTGQPRPLMSADVDRVAYTGTVLHRNLQGAWSVENLATGPGSLLAFGVDQWGDTSAENRPAFEFSPQILTISRQSSSPEIRLKNKPLADVYCYELGKAYRMSEAMGVYRSEGEGTSVDGAAFAPDAPADEFRRRAMRWVAKEYCSGQAPVFFGWEEEPAAVATADAEIRNHGRLVIWLFSVDVTEDSGHDKPL